MKNLLNTRFFDDEMRLNDDIKQDLNNDRLARWYKTYISQLIDDDFDRDQWIQDSHRITEQIKQL